MEPFVIKAAEDTPEVILNKPLGTFSISGNSFSEDPFTIYERVLSWIREYSTDPNSETVFEFKLNYVNTASSKQIVEILKLLETLSKSHNVKVLWHYTEGDDDMMDEGQELSNMFSLDFKLTEIK